ncbi:LTA synthase family protein [Methylobacter sp.]|uniref:LTA synthase family protein n=1 Tax=Methylobacter sp. TaxID=2051955 RepID=UPI002FDF04DE
MMLLGALHLLAELPRWRVLRFALRFAVITALMVMAIDIVITQQFLVRFTMRKFIKFSGEFSALKDFLHMTISGFWYSLVAVAALMSTLLTFSRYLRHDRVASFSPILFTCVGAGLIATTFLKPIEFHTLYLQNSLEAFLYSQTKNRPYTEKFKEAILAGVTEKNYCYEGKDARPDLILLVVESLSLYQSALFSGINDWMPEFDSISQKGRRFTNFYANGVTTEQGLIALLTGEPPIAKATEQAITVFEQFRDTKQSVPKMLHEFGYDSLFLTTGNLSFLGKGNWLKDIGFDYTEGHDAPYYQGMKRFNFDAAPDDALYGRALQELQRKKGRPIFMTLETVTTHHPYIDPASGIHSQKLTFRYADHQLGVFVNDLKSSGFFDKGYLIIVGDHRAMVPMSNSEKARYGDRAYARTPLTIIGHGLNGEEELASFSQSDLLPSLRHWLGRGAQCVSSDQGIFLPTAVHVPGCIFTQRSYNTDNIFIHCGVEDYTINLNGDHSQYIGAKPRPSALLKELHRLRLGGGY